MKKTIIAGAIAVLIAVVFTMDTAYGGWFDWLKGKRAKEDVTEMKAPAKVKQAPKQAPMISPRVITLKEKKRIGPRFIPTPKPMPDEEETGGQEGLITDYGDILLNYVMPNMYFYYAMNAGSLIDYQLNSAFWHLYNPQGYTEWPIEFKIIYADEEPGPSGSSIQWNPIYVISADGNLSNGGDRLLMDICTIRMATCLPTGTAYFVTTSGAQEKPDKDTIPMTCGPVEYCALYPCSLNDIDILNENNQEPQYVELITNWCVHEMNNAQGNRQMIDSIRLGFQVQQTTGGHKLMVTEEFPSPTNPNVLYQSFYSFIAGSLLSNPNLPDLDKVFPYNNSTRTWEFTEYAPH